MFWAVLVADLVQATLLSHLDYCNKLLGASPALFFSPKIHSTPWLPDSITSLLKDPCGSLSVPHIQALIPWPGIRGSS